VLSWENGVKMLKQLGNKNRELIWSIRYRFFQQIPLDKDVLRCIYDLYESEYPGPPNDPYLPIDINLVSKNLHCKQELIFGRLYFHLDKKYRYANGERTSVPFFVLGVQKKRHCVNFPYLTSILAGLEEDERRTLLPIMISIFALLFSVFQFFKN
jgi:hypothetical protein